MAVVDQAKAAARAYDRWVKEASASASPGGLFHLEGKGEDRYFELLNEELDNTMLEAMDPSSEA